MRILTAGESHGEHNVVILEGFPKGVKVEREFIDKELRRRMSGFGRGKRMSIEEDKVVIVSGLRNKVTMGSPISMLVKNKDVKIFSQNRDDLPDLTIPRPSHADLTGALKYQDIDVRNILERASARETVGRVCVGAVCEQFLSNFGIKAASFTSSIGSVKLNKRPENISDIISGSEDSKLNCIDKNKEKLMVKEIEKAEKDKDSLGGIIEVWVDGVCPGIGSFMHFDKRLDARLACYLMSIPSIKGVEVGLGFDYAQKRGSVSHDAIYYSSGNVSNAQGRKGFYRKTNNSGGIEGGMSTGEPIVLRLAMKPIATLRRPLDSVDLITRRKEKAIVERSDTCAVAACGVIAESMAMIAITEAFIEKFGCDSLKEINRNYGNYIKSLT